MNVIDKMKKKDDVLQDKTINQKKERIPMSKKKGSLKVTITDELENKFHEMRKLSPKNEFGGFLFYRIDSMDSKFSKIEITCFDALQMSVGSMAYNTFKVDGELGAYMMENDYYRDKTILCGHFHSHCNMSSSPSQTDLETYRSETLEQPVYLGLIINNSMEYIAIFTRLVEIRSASKYQEKWIGPDGKMHVTTGEDSKSTKVVQYIAGDVIIENRDSPITNRFVHLSKKREEEIARFHQQDDYDLIKKSGNYRTLFNERISRF